MNSVIATCRSQEKGNLIVKYVKRVKIMLSILLTTSLSVTYLGTVLRTWEQCYVPGNSVTYLGTVLHTWEQCYVPGNSVTYLGTVLRTWEQCYVPGNSVTYLGTVASW